MSRRERMKKLRIQRFLGSLLVLASIALLVFLAKSGGSPEDCDGTGAIFTMAMGAFMTLTKRVWLL